MAACTVFEPVFISCLEFVLEEEALDFIASVVYILNCVKVRYIVCNEERIVLEKTKL
jgi:hypothetical protein